MASGKLKTSTPLQRRYDSGYGSYDASFDKVIELSPIRKQPSLKSSLIKVCNILNNGAVKKWNQAVEKVSKKLIFASSDSSNSDQAVEKVSKKLIFAPSDSSNSDQAVEKVSEKLSALSDGSDSHSINNHTADSGIVTDSSTSIESVSEHLAAFPSDENCNTILLNYNESSKIYQPYKYICAEFPEELFESIKKEFQPKTQSTDKYLFNILDDISADFIKENTKKTAVKFDLLYELHIRNCTSILSSILSYLSEEELRIASYVSKQWQNIVFNDKNANHRRKTYIDNKKSIASGPNKENGIKTPSVQRHHKTAFISVANVEAETLPPLLFDNLSGRFDSFIEEAKLMKDKENLKKCPKCFYPSKAQSENKFCCTRKLCQHEFCKICSGPYLDDHLCSAQDLNNSVPKIIIGSKKSKKNLRRL